MEKYSQNQRERLNYLEFRIYFTGQISRNDLIQRFGISEAAATRDLAIYRKDAPDNIDLDHTTKLYRITDTFRPVFLKEIEPKLLLRALVHGIGDDFGISPGILVSCELPKRLHSPNAEVLATISRSICGQKVLKIDYLSASSGRGEREIVPFSFAGSGLKWHVRAYDRKKARFADFIVNRICAAKILKGVNPETHEIENQDDEWNRMVSLEIVPHPDNPKQKEMTELEYQMENGVLPLKVRAAMVGYVLRLWNVDCSAAHTGKDFRLWLRNGIALHGVSNLKIAPEYISPNPHETK